MATPKKEVKKEEVTDDKKQNKDGFIPNQILTDEEYRLYMLKQPKGE